MLYLLVALCVGLVAFTVVWWLGDTYLVGREATRDSDN